LGGGLVGAFAGSLINPKKRWLLTIAVFGVVIADLVDWHAFGQRTTRMKAIIGTVLLVLGIGIIATNLPEALRDVLHDNYFGDGWPFACGAMMIASGWFLRRPHTG
jgi:formate-dependent nitrite reductase membrane component NrfD